MTALNTLVDLPDQFSFHSVVAINNHGQVLVSGVVLPIPEPEMYALLLSGLVLLGFIARRKRAENYVNSG